MELDTLIPVIDNLSRAIGDLTDAFGNYSLDYVEEKVKNAHTLLFKRDKIDMYQLRHQKISAIAKSVRMTSINLTLFLLCPGFYRP